MIQEGIELKVIAIRDIQQGESVSISYIPLASDTPARRDQLQIDYNFLCQCQRCTEFDKAATTKKKSKKSTRERAAHNDESSTVDEDNESGSESVEQCILNEQQDNIEIMDKQFGKYDNVTVENVMTVDEAADPSLDDIIRIFESNRLIDYTTSGYERDWFWLNHLCHSAECQGKGLWMLDLRSNKIVCNLCRREKPSVIEN